MQWSLPGPEQHLLSKREVCQFLKIGSRALDGIISTGHFPRGVNVSRGKGRVTLRWYAVDVACYLHLCDRMREGPLEKHERGDEDGYDEEDL